MKSFHKLRELLKHFPKALTFVIFILERTPTFLKMKNKSILLRSHHRHFCNYYFFLSTLKKTQVNFFFQKFAKNIECEGLKNEEKLLLIYVY